MKEFLIFIWTELQEAWVVLQASFVKLGDLWVVKAGLGLLAQFAVWLIHLKHLQIMGVFMLLVIFDLVSKWSALSYRRLIDIGMEKPDVITKWMNIPLAWSDGYINSEHGRKPFFTKVMTYVAATGAAYLFDLMAGTPNFAVHLVWLYLGSNEFLSILENLRDGGNASMGKFLALIETKVNDRIRK